MVRALPTNIRQPAERGAIHLSADEDFEISFDPVCLKPCQAYVKYEALRFAVSTKSLKLLAIMALISLLTPANGAKWFYADIITHQSSRESQNAYQCRRLIHTKQIDSNFNKLKASIDSSLRILTEAYFS